MGYRGKTCVYCGVAKSSSTADHVLAREFVLIRHRPRLPKVPACAPCNSRKARLEAYLTTVLPFGARHATAEENLDTLVPKRLKGNPHLREQIAAGLDPRWLPEPSGLLVRTSTVTIDADALRRWCVAIVQGLAWHHWRIITAGVCDHTVETLSPTEEAAVTPVFKLPTHARIELTSIGGDVLAYEAAQDTQVQLGAAWRLVLLGGLTLGGDDPRMRSSAIWVFVRP